MGSNRLIFVIGGVVVALAIASVLVVLSVGDRTSEAYPEDTPEGALQRYLESFESGDLAGAHAWFSDRVRSEMDLASYQRMVDQFGSLLADDRPRRVLVDERVGTGDSISLRVIVEELEDGGIGASTQRYEREIRMLRQPDGWRIDEPLIWLEPGPITEPPSR